MKKTLALVLALCMMFSVALAETTEPTYTYNGSTTVFPTNWNPHQYKTATDNDFVLSWISDALFGFDYNDTFDSYAVKPQMAAGDPVDVTADYVGAEWGIAEGETARAWKYTLRDDLKWEDGTPINAQTYVESVKRQLDPTAQNYRADSLYSGTVVMHNAEAYLKQGSNADTMLGSYVNLTGAADLDAFFAEHGDEKGYIDWNNSYGAEYNWETKEWGDVVSEGIVETPLTIKELYDFYCTGEGGVFCTWADDETKAAWALEELFAKYQYPAVDFDTVGIKAASDLEVVFIIDNALEGFQLLYQLDVPLVHAELYDSCASVTDGVYTNNYGTSAETTMSYGPYRLATFQSDKQIVLEKNPNWYGYNLPENEGLYQTTNIQYDWVVDRNTAFNMFLNGQLDVIGLDKEHIDDYRASDYTYFDEGASIFAMTFNPNLEALTANQATAGENINKTILTLKEFRMAISMGLDRAAFQEAVDPSSVPGFALIGNPNIADPENAIRYRDTEPAKDAMLNFWGLADEVGEGKMYATKDEAIESIDGYAPEMAKEYFNKAYDIAIEQGLMDENDTVQIIIGLASTSQTYNNGYEFLRNNYIDLVKGTKLEGKLDFVKDDTIGNAFGDALRTNRVDMLFFVGWNGSAFDPYGLMEAYVAPAYQYDASHDYSAEMVDIELDGVTYTASVIDWLNIMNGKKTPATVTGTEEVVELVFPYSTDAAIAYNRLLILGALENAVLQNYNFIPTTADATAKLKGMQVEYFMEDEVFPMSRGGVKYMTYNYTDAEWDAYVAEQGGTLNYK